MKPNVQAGAPVTPASGARAGESACFFCATPAPADGTCPRCLVRMPRVTCASCGRASGPREIACAACGAALADAPRSLPCARCDAPLLAIGVDPATTLHACPNGHGLFIPPRAWCAMIAQPSLASAVEAKLGATAAPPSELVGMLRCPACRAQMERGRFAAASPVVIDVCVEHGTWLDSGELGGVVRHASGVAPPPREDRGNVAVEVLRAEMDATSLARLERAERTAKTKRFAAVGFVVALVLVRLVFYLAARRAHEGAATESAAAAASAGAELGGP